MCVCVCLCVFVCVPEQCDRGAPWSPASATNQSHQNIDITNTHIENFINIIAIDSTGKFLTVSNV